MGLKNFQGKDHLTTSAKSTILRYQKGNNLLGRALSKGQQKS